MSSAIRFFTMEKYNGKTGIGSTRLRAHNLIKYWDDADLYKFGENPDVMIYQKVYTTFDYKFQEHFKGIQILDMCDPDWRETPDIFVKETLDFMDAVVVPTKAMKEYLEQMTATPIRIIRDRFDLEELPPKKVHEELAKEVVWFGYIQNTGALKHAVQSIESRNLKLTVISNEDPTAYRWANDPASYEPKYTFVKYIHPEALQEIQKADVCVLPINTRPMDKFKSENKTIQSILLGVPVATNAEELDELIEADARNKTIDKVYGKIREQYDCRKSVDEYKALIEEIREKSRNE